MSEPSREERSWQSIASDWKHWLRSAAFVGRTATGSKVIRSRTLAVLFAVSFALLGVARELSWVSFVIEPPFDLDWALRTVSLGWYSPDDTLPVTIVDVRRGHVSGLAIAGIHAAWKLARLIVT